MLSTSKNTQIIKNKNKEEIMDELSMLIMNGNAEGIKEYHKRKVGEAFSSGVFVGTESTRDAIAKVLGFKTGKE